METELCDFTANELIQMLHDHRISAGEIVDAVEKRILAIEGRSGSSGYTPNIEEEKEDQTKIHAYIAPLMLDAARTQAQALDRIIALNRRISPLAGIPMAVKDAFCVKDSLTTAGSCVLNNYKAVYDATAVARLKSQGAIIVGKTNLDEFQLGSSTESSAFKPITRNPWNLIRVPGGSSGGSAAAVASGEAIFALGSDTAGSIRQPASFCGVVGLKPTYGRVSRNGLIALASSMDCVGAITKSVLDCAVVLEAIAGYDEHDWSTAQIKVPKYLELMTNNSIAKSIKRLRIGWPKEYFDDPVLLDPVQNACILKALHDARMIYEKLGAKVIEISLPHTIYAIPVYFVISRVELASNLQRYDGIRYGQRSKKDVVEIDELYEFTRSEGFGIQPKQRILMGMFVSDVRVKQLYIRARKIRGLIRRDFEEAFENVDVIMAPTTPTTAFTIGNIYGDTVQMQNADCLTVPANLAGVPAITIPCGFDQHGMPIGFQLIGSDFREDMLLQIGYTFERETEWHKVRPRIP